jgi:hypothetical protein
MPWVLAEVRMPDDSAISGGMTSEATAVCDTKELLLHSSDADGAVTLAEACVVVAAGSAESVGLAWDASPAA